MEGMEVAGRQAEQCFLHWLLKNDDGYSAYDQLKMMGKRQNKLVSMKAEACSMGRIHTHSPSFKITSANFTKL